MKRLAVTSRWPDNSRWVYNRTLTFLFITMQLSRHVASVASQLGRPLDVPNNSLNPTPEVACLLQEELFLRRL